MARGSDEQTVRRTKQHAWALAIASAVVMGATGRTPSTHAQTGCGYTMGESVPNGPACGFGPYAGHIQDIIDDGTVCGYASSLGCVDRAFVQTPGGPMVLLPNPPGTFGSRANGMNSFGTVVGNFRIAESIPVPCKWENGVCIPLPIPPQANGGEAMAINSSGTIVGHWTNTATGPGHACVWTKGVMIDIHPGEPWLDSWGTAINDAGQVAGTVFRYAWEDRAFKWSPSGEFNLLGAVPGGVTSRAVAIASNGDIVGEGFLIPPKGVTPNVRRSFIYQQGRMVDLGTVPGHSHTRVTDVSDSGRVVGSTNIPTPSRLFIWQDGVIERLYVDGASVIGSTPKIAFNEVIGMSRSRFIPLPGKQGDTNDDCAVNVTDLLCVIGSWGTNDPGADVTNDGVVNVNDLMLVVISWGT